MNEMFHQHFPDVAKAETRSATVPVPMGGIPTGEYAFLESYCTDPTCDCQRVLLFVMSRESGIVGVISYGFRADDPMRGPYLDPLHPRAYYANALLQFADEVLLADEAYVARLERHYWMMKEISPAPRDRKKKRRERKRRRGGR